MHLCFLLIKVRVRLCIDNVVLACRDRHNHCLEQSQRCQALLKRDSNSSEFGGLS